MFEFVVNAFNSLFEMPQGLAELAYIAENSTFQFSI